MAKFISTMSYWGIFYFTDTLRRCEINQNTSKTYACESDQHVLFQIAILLLYLTESKFEVARKV